MYLIGRMHKNTHTTHTHAHIHTHTHTYIHTHTAKRLFQGVEDVYVAGLEGEMYGQCL